MSQNLSSAAVVIGALRVKETPINTLESRADICQLALVKLLDQGLLCLLMEI